MEEPVIINSELLQELDERLRRSTSRVTSYLSTHNDIGNFVKLTAVVVKWASELPRVMALGCVIPDEFKDIKGCLEVNSDSLSRDLIHSCYREAVANKLAEVGLDEETLTRACVLAEVITDKLCEASIRRGTIDWRIQSHLSDLIKIVSSKWLKSRKLSKFVDFYCSLDPIEWVKEEIGPYMTRI